MSVESAAARFFQMSDDVWERHANPWSVWTRYPCLPLLAIAVWSRVWIGWMSVLLVALICLWIWLNPRVFSKPKSTDNWASKAVLGERVMLRHDKAEIPSHHRRAIRMINIITFAGFAIATYGLIVLNAYAAIVGTLITILGKSWFLDRMVWLYQDMFSSDGEYSNWLY